jgi:ATP-dependent DNA ligase
MPLKPPLPPMESRSVEEIPTGDGWLYEPKWDGFRCIAFRDGEQIYLQSKAGQPLARYFPDIAAALARLPEQQFVLDGELVVPVNGALSFDELQLRLHPAASRVERLAKANPAMYIVFDLLGDNGQVYLQRILRERRRFSKDSPVRISDRPKIYAFLRRRLITKLLANGLKKPAAILMGSSRNASTLHMHRGNAPQSLR